MGASLAALPLLDGRGAARAQPTAPAWRPDRPIQMWVGFAPGGAADVLARAVAAHIERQRGWTMPVTNRTGGAGIVMAQALRAAAPDGHTLGVTVSAALALPTFAAAPAPYALSDFTGIARLARAELALVTRADGGIRDTAALVAEARRKGVLNVATQGPEVVLGVRALARHLGITLEPIPVRGGAEGLTQLLGGHIDAAVLAGVQATGVREGRLQEVVGFGGTPTALSPQGATFRSIGLDLAVEPWFQVMAPARIPANARQIISEAVRDALLESEIQELANSRLGLRADYADADATTERTASDARALAALHAAFGG